MPWSLYKESLCHFPNSTFFRTKNQCHEIWATRQLSWEPQFGNSKMWCQGNLPNMFSEASDINSKSWGGIQAKMGETWQWKCCENSNKVTEQQVLTIAKTMWNEFGSPFLYSPKSPFPQNWGWWCDDSEGKFQRLFLNLRWLIRSSTLPHSAFVRECDIPRFVPLTRSFLCPNRSFPIPKSTKSYSWRTRVD